MFSGCMEGCDGFLYTNKDSVSVGITLQVENIHKTSYSVPQMLEEFKNRPEIQALLSGGSLLEYSAHLIPEGGMDMIPNLYGHGVLVAGDAAALCANLGFTLRGMDLAVESGRLAAQTAIAAKEKDDYSAEVLSDYQAALESSFVIPCIQGAEACRSIVESGAYKEEPLKAFNDIMEKQNIR